MKFPFCSSCCFSSSNSEPTISTLRTGEHNYENLRIFSLQELERATHGFSSANKIGEGAFGSVYRGRLRDDLIVAVKVLSVENESMSGEREFISELAAMSNIRHENLVKLQGCCVHGAKRYLVYDYMENKSLSQTLLGNEENRMKFSWEKRKEISLGVARALAYLHDEAEPQIVHRDIKASNILLDQNFMPKVADFGLSRLLRDQASHVSTRVAGTLGYLAPEYAITGHLTRKSDVYSFGVLLLEIISGRSAMDYNLELGEHYIVQKAWDAYKNEKLVEVLDPTLDMKFREDEAVRLLMVSLLCLQQNAKLRPQMSTAVKMMNNETDIKDVHISQPGLVSNLSAIRLQKKNTSETDSSNRGSTSSPRNFYSL